MCLLYLQHSAGVAVAVALTACRCAKEGLPDGDAAQQQGMAVDEMCGAFCGMLRFFKPLLMLVQKTSQMIQHGSPKDRARMSCYVLLSLAWSVGMQSKASEPACAAEWNALLPSRGYTGSAMKVTINSKLEKLGRSYKGWRSEL